MVTVLRDIGDVEHIPELVAIGSGTSAQNAIDSASAGIRLGEEATLWQRVGKPRVAQMRLV